ncbi:MAG: hypothetical protein JXA37_02360 [Chloroflexia bacterium]|nr:hypothetical protein [Chloroflexia bacterium]
MDETLSTAFYVLSFLLTLGLVVGLWWCVRRSDDAGTRRLWTLLALAWTVNLLGDLAWGVYDMAVGGYPDWVDLFYMGRYLLVLAAFSLYPQVWSRGRWLAWVVVMLAAALASWLGLVRPVLDEANETLGVVWGRALYPILDAGLLYAAVACWWRQRGQAIGISLRWLTLAMLAYGAANWINFRVPLVEWELGGLLANLCWLACTLLAGAAAWQFLRKKSTPQDSPFSVTG